MPFQKKSAQQTEETKKSSYSGNDVTIEDIGSDEDEDENPRVNAASMDELEALFRNIFGEKENAASGQARNDGKSEQCNAPINGVGPGTSASFGMAQRHAPLHSLLEEPEDVENRWSFFEMSTRGKNENVQYVLSILKDTYGVVLQECQRERLENNPDLLPEILDGLDDFINQQSSPTQESWKASLLQLWAYISGSPAKRASGMESFHEDKYNWFNAQPKLEFSSNGAGRAAGGKNREAWKASAERDEAIRKSRESWEDVSTKANQERPGKDNVEEVSPATSEGDRPGVRYALIGGVTGLQGGWKIVLGLAGAALMGTGGYALVKWLQSPLLEEPNVVGQTHDTQGVNAMEERESIARIVDPFWDQLNPLFGSEDEFVDELMSAINEESDLALSIWRQPNLLSDAISKELDSVPRFRKTRHAQAGNSVSDERKEQERAKFIRLVVAQFRWAVRASKHKRIRIEKTKPPTPFVLSPELLREISGYLDIFLDQNITTLSQVGFVYEPIDPRTCSLFLVDPPRDDFKKNLHLRLMGVGNTTKEVNVVGNEQLLLDMRQHINAKTVSRQRMNECPSEAWRFQVDMDFPVSANGNMSVVGFEATVWPSDDYVRNFWLTNLNDKVVVMGDVVGHLIVRLNPLLPEQRQYLEGSTAINGSKLPDDQLQGGRCIDLHEWFNRGLEKGFNNSFMFSSQQTAAGGHYRYKWKTEKLILDLRSGAGGSIDACHQKIRRQIAVAEEKRWLALFANQSGTDYEWGDPMLDNERVAQYFVELKEKIKTEQNMHVGLDMLKQYKAALPSQVLNRTVSLMRARYGREYTDFDESVNDPALSTKKLLMAHEMVYAGMSLMYGEKWLIGRPELAWRIVEDQYAKAPSADIDDWATELINAELRIRTMVTSFLAELDTLSSEEQALEAEVTAGGSNATEKIRQLAELQSSIALLRLILGRFDAYADIPSKTGDSHKDQEKIPVDIKVLYQRLSEKYGKKWFTNAETRKRFFDGILDTTCDVSPSGMSVMEPELTRRIRVASNEKARLSNSTNPFTHRNGRMVEVVNRLYDPNHNSTVRDEHYLRYEERALRWWKEIEATGNLEYAFVSETAVKKALHLLLQCEGGKISILQLVRMANEIDKDAQWHEHNKLIASGNLDFSYEKWVDLVHATIGEGAAPSRTERDFIAHQNRTLTDIQKLSAVGHTNYTNLHPQSWEMSALAERYRLTDYAGQYRPLDILEIAQDAYDIDSQIRQLIAVPADSAGAKEREIARAMLSELGLMEGELDFLLDTAFPALRAHAGDNQTVVDITSKTTTIQDNAKTTDQVIRSEFGLAESYLYYFKDIVRNNDSFAYQAELADILKKIDGLQNRGFYRAITDEGLYEASRSFPGNLRNDTTPWARNYSAKGVLSEIAIPTVEEYLDKALECTVEDTFNQIRTGQLTYWKKENDDFEVDPTGTVRRKQIGPPGLGNVEITFDLSTKNLLKSLQDALSNPTGAFAADVMMATGEFTEEQKQYAKDLGDVFQRYFDLLGYVPIVGTPIAIGIAARPIVLAVVNIVARRQESVRGTKEGIADDELFNQDDVKDIATIIWNLAAFKIPGHNLGLASPYIGGHILMGNGINGAIERIFPE